MAHEHHSEVGQSRGAGNGALAASGYGLGANAGFSPRELHLAIRIDNYGQAAECFGLRYADRLADAVCASLRGLGESGQIDRAVVLHAGDGWVQAVFASEGGDCLPLVHACCVVTATTPISVGRGKIVPVLSFGMPPLGAAIDGRDRDAALLRAARAVLEGEADGACGQVTASSPAFHEQDMAVAADLLLAVREGGLPLVWQSVRDAHESGNILYREARLRKIDGQGISPTVGDAIQAAERVGCVAALDCCVVSRVLDELQADPDVRLGVNISARSARLSFWWTELLARLRADRSLASRLFIEITETAPLPRIGDVVAFADCLRGLGCRIVIDNFGVGYSSIRTIMALRPDAVKVDAFYLKRASKTETDRRTYDHLVGLAATLAGTVIAKGVESAEDSELACDAGAYWQQGDHQGAPSLGRSWIPDRRNDQIAALEQFRDACRRGGSSGQMRGYAA